MTTPANPTPEPDDRQPSELEEVDSFATSTDIPDPTPICDAEEHVLKQMGQPEGLITVGTGRDLERQLSGTRRRLAEVAEVEKERDEQNVTIETLTKHHRSCMDSRNAYAQNAAKAGVTIAEQKAKLTALRNAADGALSLAVDMSGLLLAACETCEGPIFNEDVRAALDRLKTLKSAYAALTEGAGK